MNNFPIILLFIACSIVSADEKCPATCPLDCGMTRDKNGCATCHCDGPFFQTPPRLPPRPHKQDADVEATDGDGLQTGDICRLKCPQDCGCTVDYKNEATCQCTAENHPLIPPTRPPGFQCAPPLCESPCYLHNDVTKICPVCKCPESN